MNATTTTQPVARFSRTRAERVGLTLEQDQLTYEQILQVGRVLHVIQASAERENAAGVEYPTAVSLLDSPRLRRALDSLGEWDTVLAHEKISIRSVDLNDSTMVNLDVYMDEAGSALAWQHNRLAFEPIAFGSNLVASVALTNEAREGEKFRDWSASVTFKEGGELVTMKFTSDVSQLPQSLQRLYPEAKEVHRCNYSAFEQGPARDVTPAVYMFSVDSVTPSILEVNF